MGIESADGESADARSIATLADELGTESVSYVDALNDEIAAVVENDPDLQYDYVVGDVADWGVSANGHGHFDLVHDGSSMHCVVFEYRLNHLDLTLEDGTQVAVKGDLSYYADEGSVSVIVEDVVAIGDGTYQQIYEENRKRLAEDGCLDDDAKLSLPDRPTRIGIVTSADSDAREDAITSIHARYPDVDVVVHDVPVQGDDAMAAMMEGISVLDDDVTVDVIVLTRGGGATKHLRVFNETPLCRVIHRTSTPVVVGVGHENDRTLADDVADRRVMTPTEVGEIVPRKADLVESIDTLDNRLRSAYERTITERLSTMDTALVDAYEDHVQTTLDSHRTALDHAAETHTRERLTDLSNRLEHGYAQLEQRAEHEAEHAATVEAYERSRRRLVIALVVLGLLVLVLGAYVLFGP